MKYLLKKQKYMMKFALERNMLMLCHGKCN
jgi:hypothetical protein